MDDDFTDAVVLRIPYIEITRRVNHDAMRMIKPCFAPLSIGKSFLFARKGADFSLGRELEDAVIRRIHYIEVACRVFFDPAFIRPCRVFFAISTTSFTARKGANFSLRCDYADAAVSRIRHKELAHCVNHNNVRLIKPGSTPLAIGKGWLAAARKGTDDNRFSLSRKAYANRQKQGRQYRHRGR